MLLVRVFCLLSLVNEITGSCTDRGVASGYDVCYSVTDSSPAADDTYTLTVDETCYSPYFEVYSNQAETDSPQDTEQSISIDFNPGSAILYSNVLKQTDSTFYRCNGAKCIWREVFMVKDFDNLPDVSSEMTVDIISINNFRTTGTWTYYIHCSSTPITTTPQPSKSPTNKPTTSPTKNPSPDPTFQPTDEPTRQPSTPPTRQPTNQPSKSPTNRPSTNPTIEPSGIPSITPTNEPTELPTFRPTRAPLNATTPTKWPSIAPSDIPSTNPSQMPTLYPTYPTNKPTNIPSKIPSDIPSTLPSNNPTSIPTVNPTNQPTDEPTRVPSISPTEMPLSPSIYPTLGPSLVPTGPTNEPTTGEPTLRPSFRPSISPTLAPTIGNTFVEEQITKKNKKNDDISDFIYIIIIGLLCFVLCLFIIGIILCVRYQKRQVLLVAGLTEMKNKIAEKNAQSTLTSMDSAEDITNIKMVDVGLGRNSKSGRNSQIKAIQLGGNGDNSGGGRKSRISIIPGAINEKNKKHEKFKSGVVNYMARNKELDKLGMPGLMGLIDPNDEGPGKYANRLSVAPGAYGSGRMSIMHKEDGNAAPAAFSLNFSYDANSGQIGMIAPKEKNYYEGFTSYTGNLILSTSEFGENDDMDKAATDAAKKEEIKEKMRKKQLEFGQMLGDAQTAEAMVFDDIVDEVVRADSPIIEEENNDPQEAAGFVTKIIDIEESDDDNNNNNNGENSNNNRKETQGGENLGDSGDLDNNEHANVLLDQLEINDIQDALNNDNNNNGNDNENEEMVTMG